MSRPTYPARRTQETLRTFYSEVVAYRARVFERLHATAGHERVTLREEATWANQAALGAAGDISELVTLMQRRREKIGA